jgi:hypothetical protein
MTVAEGEVVDLVYQQAKATFAEKDDDEAVTLLTGLMLIAMQNEEASLADRGGGLGQLRTLTYMKAGLARVLLVYAPAAFLAACDKWLGDEDEEADDA